MAASSGLDVSGVTAWEAQHGPTLSPTAAPENNWLENFIESEELVTCVENCVTQDQANNHADKQLHWVGHRHLQSQDDN